MSIMACNKCGTVYGPTILICPKCGSGDVGRVELSPEALPSNNASESDQSPSPSEQEDKPTNGCHKCGAVYPAGEEHGCEDKPTTSQCLYANDKGVCDCHPTDSKPENYDRNLQSYLDAGGKIRDLPPDSLGLSKPEKPHEHKWQDYPNGTFCLGCGRVKLPEDTMAEIRDTADKMYGPLAKELSKTSAVIEPSKPDQLRERYYKLTDPTHPNMRHALAEDERERKLQALLATTARAEYDRGAKDGYKKGLEQNTAYFSQRKAEYDRGKVEGAVEELGLLAKETGPGKPGETWEQWAYRVSDYLKDRLVKLKSKGESLK